MKPSGSSKQLAQLQRMQELKKNFALFFYKPYKKQFEFHEAGKHFRERLLMAGNQLGKTLAAGHEVTFHATGLYPDWWDGRVMEHENRGWVVGLTSEMTRDGAQRILLGPAGQWGTGAIPKELIIDIKRARGVPDAVETILVKHVPSGGVSQITFKAYSDGREAFQSETLDWIWMDEEPPYDIYTEALTRTNKTTGPVFITFTPLLGMSDVVVRFMQENRPDCNITNMTIDDVEHYTDEQKRTIIAQYPAHELEARTKGIPMLGSGRVFPIAESVLVEEPIGEIPAHWPQIIGMDFGWDHPTAAVKIVYDPSADCIHVVNAYRQKEQTPLIHAAAIKPFAHGVPVAWPHDALQHDKRGEQFYALYRDQGLRMLSEHAQFGDKRGNSVEAGLADILQRMQTGRFKVDRTLQQWWEEFRIYHRKDGKIVKEREDLMDATRYAVMMLRYAIAGEQVEPRPDKYRRNHGHGGSWMSA
jgi:phage terminase large subunit-like protein